MREAEFFVWVLQDRNTDGWLRCSLLPLGAPVPPSPKGSTTNMLLTLWQGISVSGSATCCVQPCQDPLCLKLEELEVVWRKGKGECMLMRWGLSPLSPGPSQSWSDWFGEGWVGFENIFLFTNIIKMNIQSFYFSLGAPENISPSETLVRFSLFSWMHEISWV